MLNLATSKSRADVHCLFQYQFDLYIEITAWSPRNEESDDAKKNRADVELLIQYRFDIQKSMIDQWRSQGGTSCRGPIGPAF